MMIKFYFNRDEENAFNTNAHLAEIFDNLSEAIEDAEEIFTQTPGEYTNVKTEAEQLPAGVVVKCDYDEGERYNIYRLWTTATDEDGETEEQATYVAIVDFVLNGNGDRITFSAAVELMDDEIREDLHAEYAPCSKQHFYDRYAKAHAEKYGEEFGPESGEW